MSAFVSTLPAGWMRSVSAVRALLMIPEPEPLDYPFVASDVAQLHRLRHDPAQASIDDTTWDDLLLESYRGELSLEVSIFGQQVLYRRLRAEPDDTGAARIRALIQDAARRDELHRVCMPLRRADKEIATLLYEEACPPLPRWAGKTWPLPILLVATIAAVAWSQLAWVATGMVLYFLMANQMRYHHEVQDWLRSMNSVQMLLRVTSQLGGKDADAAARLNRALTRSPFVDTVPLTRDYLDWFTLGNVNHYFRGIRLVHGNLALLRECFTRTANLEADVALARHLQRTPVLCWAGRSAALDVTLEQTVHPLLPQAQPLSIVLQGRGAFISGQNGVGKSTLLRTLGLNLVAARAFGFCYARQAAVPDLPVYSSMQSEDSLFGGESLYMAELRRAKELLAAAEGAHPGIYIIDEIFRGTNHLESVSAAASVLDVLASKGLVIVSSHNLVLASLLGRRLDPLCVTKGADGVLDLAPGVLAHTNGIALLSERGFGPEVEANACKVFDWLSAYLAHPADSSGVLAGY